MKIIITVLFFVFLIGASIAIKSFRIMKKEKQPRIKMGIISAALVVACIGCVIATFFVYAPAA